MANSGKGIWLYFSKKGSLISKIQHGEVIRQGGSFRLIFAFEDVEMIKDKTLTVAFKKPGSETTPAFLVGSIATQDLDSNEHRITFNKIKATEMTYGLKDGERYYCLDFDAPSGYGITEKYGMLNVITKISTTNGAIDGVDLDADGIADNDHNDDTVYFQGSVQLYIEPVYGKQPESSNIPITQYEALLKHIDEIDRKKVNIDTGRAENLTLEGIIDAQNPDTHIIINTPRPGADGEHDAATREYVDNSFTGSPTIVNPTLKGIVDARTVHIDDEGNEIKTEIHVNDLDVNTSPSVVTNKKYVDEQRDELDRKKVDVDFGVANNPTLRGVVNATGTYVDEYGITRDTFIKVNRPQEDDHAASKRYVDLLEYKVDEHKEIIDQHDTAIDHLSEAKLNNKDGVAENLTLTGETDATETKLIVKDVDDSTKETEAVNKKYVDVKFDNLKINKYTYSEEELKEQLKRNGENINPITVARNVKIDINQTTSNVQEVIDSIRNDLINQKHFQGIVEDIKLLNDYDNYKPGDYAIVAREGDDDILYIWDEGSTADGPNTNGKGQWIQKGTYAFAIKSVNGELPNELTGDVYIDSSKIPHEVDENGTVAYTVKSKLDELERQLKAMDQALGGSFQIISALDFDLRLSTLKPGMYVMPALEDARTITYKTEGIISVEEKKTAIVIVESNVSDYNAFEVHLSTGDVLKGKAFHSTEDGYVNRIIENNILYSTNKEVALKEDLDALADKTAEDLENLENKTEQDLNDAKNEINGNINDFKDETNSNISNITNEITVIKGEIGSLDLSQLKFKGPWASGTNYKTNDIVSVDGKHLYVCIKDIENSTISPNEDTQNENWVIFVQGFSGEYGDLSGTPTVDTEMSDTSENAVQNKVIKAYIDGNIPDVSDQINVHNDDDNAHPKIQEELEEIRSLLPTVTILG